MPIGKKIRIYDLARELKQDAKRVMEDLRREGADVSVPSNSVSMDIAEKVRLKYFPKTEVAPRRGIKIIKASKKSDTPHTDEVEEPIVEEAPPVEIAEAPEEVPVEAVPEVAAAPAVRKILKKKPEAEVPVEVEPVAEVTQEPVEITAPDEAET